MPALPPTAAPGQVISTQVITASPPPPRTRWYGPTALGVDAGLAVAAIAAIKMESGIGALPVLALSVSGPLTHLAHKRQRAALASLGLRLGLPIVMGIGGYYVEDARCVEREAPCGPEVVKAAISSALIGLAVGVVADWALVPHQELIPEERTKSRRNPRRAAMVAPVVSVHEHGAWFGAAASF